MWVGSWGTSAGSYALQQLDMILGTDWLFEGLQVFLSL